MRLTTVVPDCFTCMPIGAALERSTMPGTIGWWKCMSCSPWTTNGNASAGVTCADRAAHRVPHRHDREHRRRELAVGVRRDRVVGGRGVRLDPVGFDLELAARRSTGRPCRWRTASILLGFSGSACSLPSRLVASVSTFVRAVGHGLEPLAARSARRSPRRCRTSRRRCAASAAWISASSASSCSRIDSPSRARTSRCPVGGVLVVVGQLGASRRSRAVAESPSH